MYRSNFSGRYLTKHGDLSLKRTSERDRICRLLSMVTIFKKAICVLLLVFCLMSGAQTASGKWEITTISGVEYVKLSDVWKFYRFSPQKGREGCVSYGAGNRIVSVKPSKQDFYVNNFRYILSYPIRERAGQLMISTVDMKKLVDPVLRPKFSKENGKVTTIVIDPGHGAHDAGAVSSYAVEKNCNLAVALKLKYRLERAGFKVVMTRSNDTFLTLGQRVAIANRTPDSIFVSIHHNSGRRAASGIETFTLAPHGTTSPFARTRRTEELSGNDQDAENIAFTTAIHSRAIKNTGAVDRGIQRARFSVLCTIKRPAILFEGGFVTNPEEGARISSNAYQDKLADSICAGIISYCQTMTNRGSALKTRHTSSSPTGSVRIHGSNSYKGTTRLK